MTTLFDIAQNWLNQDPDAETHAELTALLTVAKNGDEKAQSELQTRFSGRLQFWYCGASWTITSRPYGYEPCFSGTSCGRFSRLLKDYDNNLPS